MRTWVLLLLAGLGSSGCTQGEWLESNDIPDFTIDEGQSPSWLVAQPDVFWEYLDEPRGHQAPVVRARVTTTAEYADGEEETRQETRYVRFEPEAHGYRVRPQCSALSDTMSFPSNGEWHAKEQPVEGAKQDIEVTIPPHWAPLPRDFPNTHISVEVEALWAPSPPPLYAWSLWLYTRSFVVSRAGASGLRLEVHGSADCDDFRGAPFAEDACRAPAGSPIFALVDDATLKQMQNNGSYAHLTPWRMLGSRVGMGAWMGFCGRAVPTTWNFASAEDLAERMEAQVQALQTAGFEPERFVPGALLTFDDQFYPMADVRLLSQITAWFHWSEKVIPVVSRLARDPLLDWQNRIRAHAFLTLHDDEKVSGAHLRQWVAEATGVELEESVADDACLFGLIGGFNLGCAAG